MLWRVSVLHSPAFSSINLDFHVPQVATLALKSFYSRVVTKSQARQSEVDGKAHLDSQIYSRSGFILKEERLEPVKLTKLCHPLILGKKRKSHLVCGGRFPKSVTLLPAMPDGVGNILMILISIEGPGK